MARSSNLKRQQMLETLNYMEQQSKTFRIGTRLFAILELLAASLTLFVAVFVLMVTIVVSMDPAAIYGDDYSKNLPKARADYFVCMHVVFAIFFAIEAVFHFIAGVSLLTSTKTDVATPQAVECIRFWRSVTLLLYAQYIFFLFAAGNYPFAFGLFAIRAMIHVQVEGYKMTFGNRDAGNRIRQKMRSQAADLHSVKVEPKIQVVTKSRENKDAPTRF